MFNTTFVRVFPTFIVQFPLQFSSLSSTVYVPSHYEEHLVSCLDGHWLCGDFVRPKAAAASLSATTDKTLLAGTVSAGSFPTTDAKKEGLETSNIVGSNLEGYDGGVYGGYGDSDDGYDGYGRHRRHHHRHGKKHYGGYVYGGYDNYGRNGYY